MSESSSPIQTSSHPLTSLRERLVQARYQRDWSQQELADLLGSTPLNVSRWERGLTTPNPYFRNQLCRVFGLTEVELGLRPDPSLLSPPTQRAREISVLSPPPLYDPFLPLPAGVPLVGRSSLLDQLKNLLLSSRTVALSALQGLPGVGKTALALELAYDSELREQYPDGLLWAALGPQPNLLGVLSRWGKLLGINEDEAVRLSTPASWTRTLRATIGTRRLLFVLDDAWHLEHALTCQVGGAHCGYVLTTRLPQVAQGFAPTQACLVEALDEEASLELLRQLAPWALSQAGEHLRPLVQAVGGLPLALSLIGHYLRLQTHDRQPRRLQAALNHLQDHLTRLQITQPRAHSETGMGEQLSLQAIIKISAEQLSQQARQAWEMLSVLPARPNSFSEAAALAVSEAPAQMLDELSDAGLLEAVGSARYTFHQTIADYGRAQLSASTQQEAVKRLIDYSQQYARANSSNNSALEEEASVMSVALEECHTLSEKEALLSLVLTLTPFWKSRGDSTQTAKWFPRATEVARILERRGDEARVQVMQGEFVMHQGDYEQALLSYEQALEHARQANEAEQICDSLIGIGWVHFKCGKYEQAEHVLDEGLTLARKQGLLRQQAGLLRVLGSVCALQGKAEQGLASIQEGLELAQQIKDHELTCILLNNLGGTYSSSGDIRQAEKILQRGLLLAQQQGYRQWEGLLLANLAVVTVLQGEYKQAEHYGQEGLRLARQMGNLDHVCVALMHLSEITVACEKHDQAQHYAQEGLNLARQIGNLAYLSRVTTALGKISFALGKYEQAEQYLQEALSLSRQIGDTERVCAALMHQGEVFLAQGKYEQTEQVLQECLPLTRRAGLFFYAGMVLTLLGELALARKTFEQAEQYCQEGLSLLRQFGTPEYIAGMLTRLGAIAIARSNYGQAEQYLQEGLHLIRQRKIQFAMWSLLSYWGTLCLLRGQLEDATVAFQDILANVPADARHEQAYAQYGMGRVALAQGKIAEARRLGQEALTALQNIGRREAIEVKEWLESLEQQN